MKMNVRIAICAGVVGTVCAVLPPAFAESLFQEANFQSLTAARRAYRPGDSLTVQIYENASASASADTKTRKSGGLSLGLSTHNTDKNLKVELAEDGSGEGRIQRSGRVVAQITVTVTDVTPNGELVVAGEQLIFVNGEKQQIVLSGRVRPIDITELNTVLSTRVADARITYVGDGILAEKQRMGLIPRILSCLGLL